MNLFRELLSLVRLVPSLVVSLVRVLPVFFQLGIVSRTLKRTIGFSLIRMNAFCPKFIPSVLYATLTEHGRDRLFAWMLRKLIPK